MPGNKNSGGRNAKSAQLHILQGTFRKDRFDGDAPSPPVGDPIPPRRLTGDELAEWKRMVERLRKSRILSTVDDGSLLQCVELFAEVQETRRTRRRLQLRSLMLQRQAQKLEGMALVDAIKGIAALEGLLDKKRAQLRQGHMALRMWYIEFGLTPSARTRVKVNPEGKPRDPAKQAFLAGLNLA